MNDVAVSVILPAYNCEKFIGQAIGSVLQQTFTDFELIIINDGSTDKTEFSIIGFDDPRIVYIKNQHNRGLIFTLNRAIDIAKGKYIARMDADDICKPQRLSKQKELLDRHDDLTMVASTIDLIDENGADAGVWELDRKTVDPEQIKKRLVHENCIAHPTVMIRAGVLKEFKYTPGQVNIEDYDLWLRLLSHGHRISKINEPLLLYRIHGSSITNLDLKNKNYFFKYFRMKRKFLAREFSAGHVNGFSLRVMAGTVGDVAMGVGKSIKNLFK
jgi:glycosyltransferase involved in cell wall biosynthesis